MRGTGVGSAVAIGRLGSFVGPLFAGALLTLGGTNLVIGASIPVIIIATIAALLLTRRFAKK
jgi:AAHS family 3-hydroxyphenylpropionic acid transporter